MQYFTHISVEIRKFVIEKLMKDRSKFDKPETYVRALVGCFYSNGDGRPWFYQDGRFRVLDDLRNESEIADFIFGCEGNPTKTKVSEVVFQISRLAASIPDAADGLNLQNGFLVLNGEQAVLQPHSESLGQRYILPYAYNPDASCPQWLTFLERVQPDPEIRGYLQDFYGYIMLGSSRPNAECYAAWMGEGANGKSVALSVLQNLIGHENYSSLSLHELKPRDTEDLANKIANIGSETERSQSLQTSVLKKLVSLEPIRAEPKYRRHYNFVSSAVPVFAVNDLPAIDDRTDGIWRRMHLIKWSVTIPQPERDLALTKKLESELEGILNWVITGAQRVLKRGLVVPAQVKEATAEARREANSAAMFVCEAIEQRDDCYIAKDDLYQAYATWCKRNGYRALSVINFAKDLKRSLTDVRESKSKRGYVDWRGRVVLTRVNVWAGIHIPVDRIEREVNVDGRRVVIADAIGSHAKPAHLGYGLRVVA
jgi:P4 family phage/plasmid primase-like protien